MDDHLLLQNSEIRRGKGISLEEVLLAERTFCATPASCAVRKDVELGSMTEGSLEMIDDKKIEIPRM